MTKHIENEGSLQSNVEFYRYVAPYYGQIYEEVNAAEVVRQWSALLEDMRCIPVMETGGDRMMRLIDIGCGPGRYLPEWSKAGFKVAGLDSSEEMLKEATSYYKRVCQSGEVDTYLVDICNVRDVSADAPFDIAVSHFNFLNLFSPKQVVKVFTGVKRFLKRGRIWITDFCEAKELLEDFDETFRLESGGDSARRERRHDQEGSYTIRLRGKDIDITERYWLENTSNITSAAKQTGFDLVGCFEWHPNGMLGETPVGDPVRQLLCIFRLTN
jgi:SAM-dependent methyltransferase